MEEHREHLHIVLQQLRDHQVYARFRKGEFLLNEVLRLGHIVLVEVIEVDLSKMGDELE
jgi:hypothetical protein